VAETAPADDSAVPMKLEYLDVISATTISDVRTTDGFSFSARILNTEG
jgi:hypothetical protein